MKKRSDRKGLLDSICEAVGYDYLSELHNPLPIMRPLIIKIILRLSECNYSLEEWAEAAHYITGASQRFDSKEGAVKFMVDYLNCRKR